MEIKTILLTPDMAKGLLGSIDERQRKLSMTYAATIARDITAGNWNDDYAKIDVPITVTSKGKLSNGQNRCMGVVLADRPIITRIAYGVDEELFEYMDNAKSRTTAQFVNNRFANTVASVAKFSMSIERGNELRTSIRRPNMGGMHAKGFIEASRAETLKYIKVNSEALEFCAEQGQRIYRSFSSAGQGKGAICNALWLLLYLQTARGSIVEFVDDICSTLPESEAIAKGKELAMRKIISAQKERVSIDKLFWFALILEMFDKRKTATKIRGTAFIDKCIDKYSQMVKERRAQIEIEQV